MDFAAPRRQELSESVGTSAQNALHSGILGGCQDLAQKRVQRLECCLVETDPGLDFAVGEGVNDHGNAMNCSIAHTGMGVVLCGAKEWLQRQVWLLLVLVCATNSGCSDRHHGSIAMLPVSALNELTRKLVSP